MQPFENATVVGGASAGAVVRAESRYPNGRPLSLSVLLLVGATESGFDLPALIRTTQQAGNEAGHAVRVYVDSHELGDLVPNSRQFMPAQFKAAANIVGEQRARRPAPLPYQPLLDLLMGIERGGTETEESAERQWAVDMLLEQLFQGDQATAAAWAARYPFQLLQKAATGLRPPDVLWISQLMDQVLVGPVQWGQLMDAAIVYYCMVRILTDKAPVVVVADRKNVSRLTRALRLSAGYDSGYVRWPKGGHSLSIDAIGGVKARTVRELVASMGLPAPPLPRHVGQPPPRYVDHPPGSQQPRQPRLVSQPGPGLTPFLLQAEDPFAFLFESDDDMQIGQLDVDALWDQQQQINKMRRYLSELPN